MKQVLVTGSNGFIGRHIIEELSAKGYNVVGIARNHNDKMDFPVITHDLAVSFNFQHQFDAIIHTAGSLPYNQDDFREFKKNNIDTMVNLIDFAKYNHIVNFINLSTIGVYGEFRNEEVDENTDIINPDYYGLTKYVAEQLLNAESSINSINIRMPGVIGKGSRGIWLTNTVNKLKNNDDIKIYSPDFKTKNFVYIDDLKEFICNLLTMDKFLHNTIILGCIKGNKVIDIINRVKMKTGSQSKIIIDNSIRKSFCINSSKAVEMGFHSRTPLEIVDAYIDCLNVPEGQVSCRK